MDKVWDNVDKIVVGNEPFIESKSTERGKALSDFYIEMAKKVKSYRDSKTNKPDIYIGSFDNQYIDTKQKIVGVITLLDYAKNTSWIKGVDMHIHGNNIEEIKTAMDYVNSKIDTKKIIITEYSLMKYWRAQMGSNIPSTFATTYNKSKTLKNWEYINSCLQNPVSRVEWVDFLSKSTCFESRKKYLSNSYNDYFKKYSNFEIATYAILQTQPSLGASTDPWLLNGLFANKTVNLLNGKPQFTYALIDEFRSVPK